MLLDVFQNIHTYASNPRLLSSIMLVHGCELLPKILIAILSSEICPSGQCMHINLRKFHTMNIRQSIGDVLARFSQVVFVWFIPPVGRFVGMFPHPCFGSMYPHVSFVFVDTKDRIPRGKNQSAWRWSSHVADPS